MMESEMNEYLKYDKFEMVEDIYGFEVSEGMVSDITDKFLL